MIKLLAVLLVAALLLSLGCTSPSTDTPTGDDTGVSGGTTPAETSNNGSTESAQTANLTCEEILSSEFLEDLLGGPLEEYNSDSGDNYLGCNYVVNISEEDVRSGGVMIFTFASNYDTMKELYADDSTGVAGIGADAFEFKTVTNIPSSDVPMMDLTQLIFKSSNGDYAVDVMHNYFLIYDQDPSVQYERAIAKEVNSNLR